MKRVILIVLFLSLLVLSGCIVSSSPSSSLLMMDKGDTLEFSATVSPATCQVQWTLEYLGNVQDTSNGLTYSFTPAKQGMFQMTLDVTDPYGSSQNRIWVIYVQ
jgi:hypothetical protein